MEFSATDLSFQQRQLRALEACLPEPDFENFPNNPQHAFQGWLLEALAAEVKEPHSMTLSTVDEQNRADARVVSLKDVDSRGWHFAAKSSSPKGEQIRNNQHVALTFYWPEQGRQVRIKGTANELSEAECMRDFANRSLDSRAATVASKQSSVLQGRDELKQAVQKARGIMREVSGSIGLEVKIFAVAPNTVEFWQGSPDRLHHRMRYILVNELQWQKQLLWP